MEVSRLHRINPALILTAAGGSFALFAVADKLLGLINQPLYLSTLAYASLLLAVIWTSWRGIRVNRVRFLRLSVYATSLLLVALTATFVFAIRWSSDPTSLLLLSQLKQGDAYLADGRKDDALLVYRSAYQRFPNSFPVLMRLGAANYQLFDYTHAERYFSRAVEVAPPGSRWRALNDLGQTYWKLKRPEKAIELYEQAHDEGGMPTTADVLTEWHYRLGWAYFDLGNYDLAIQHYQAVAQAGGKYASASYYNIACALCQRIRHTKDPAERTALIAQAVDNLRLTWTASGDNDDEKDALRRGLFGPKADRDPELAPLLGTPQLAALIRELRGP